MVWSESSSVLSSGGAGASADGMGRVGAGLFT
jgi:hypothetical protein